MQGRVSSEVPYAEDKPWFSRKREALWLKLRYALSTPISRVWSSIMSTIMATSKYAKPVTMQVERSPTLSSPLKYWTHRVTRILLFLVVKDYAKF